MAYKAPGQKFFFTRSFFKRLFSCGLAFCLAALIAGSAPIPAQARGPSGERPVIIRDAEMENTFKEWLTPLLKAAGIDVNGVHLIIVQSNQINAFVAGGANIFIYTGLIEKTDNPGELIGVMAHELGHIAGGHLIAGKEAMERASYESILGMVLGVGAAMATGEGGAAQTIAVGSSSMAMRNYLAHSRVQESSADQAALRFMEGAQFSPKGLESFFEKLESEEMLPADQQSEYMRTHPLTRDRIDAVHDKASQSPYLDKPFPAEWIEQHKRVKAKLIGFITPNQIPWVYDDRDHSIPAEYARAIAAYRNHDIKPALSGIDGLIKAEPENPYFQELKGQMLMDFGKVPESLPYYKKAVQILPNAGLIRTALGHAELESGHDQDAIDDLERAQQDEPRSSLIFRLLATAYGKLGNENMARLNLAEEAVLQRQIPYAKNQAESVLKNAKQGSREWLKARDILSQLENIDKDDDE